MGAIVRCFRPHALLLLLVATMLAGCARPASSRAETLAHPDRPDARIEYFVDRPAGRGPWPTVIFLHGHQGPMARVGGAAFVRWGVLRRFAGRGDLAISVSLPGYGGSLGPEDFAGPFTQHAVRAVIDHLVAEHLAAPGRIAIEGISLGAVTAGLVAAHDRRITGLVLISGLYDLPAFFAHPPSAAALGVKAAALEQSGGGDAALRARSLLPRAPSIHARTLILNGAKDDRTDPEQARRLGAAINAAGGRATVRIYPAFGHEIPVRARDAEVTAFLDGVLSR